MVSCLIQWLYVIPYCHLNYCLVQSLVGALRLAPETLPQALAPLPSLWQEAPALDQPCLQRALAPLRAWPCTALEELVWMRVFWAPRLSY